MALVAVIPVKHTSERVQSKNFRSFYEGKSLLDIKIEQLKNTPQIDQIYISSDSPEAELACEKHGVTYLSRDESLCNNVTPWSDVIHAVVDATPVGNDDHVAWCHTTSPNFDCFEKAIKDYLSAIEEGNCNGLVAVSPCKEFIVDDMATPVNYSWGPWHKYSQDLRKYFFVSGALFLSKKSEYLRNRYVISTLPKLFVASSEASIDIDTEFDYEFARYVYSQKHKANG
jgi:CMP-N-acetylneuraminic acid synthetase